MKKLVTKIKFCHQCPHHKIVDDGDPFDSFNMDDCAVACGKVKKIPNRGSIYRADWSEFKIVECALRPYEVKKVKIPNWCPL